MSDEPRDESCEVCGRSLLPGERPTPYLTRDGAEAAVCELCRPRAEAAGWLRPHEAEAQGGIGRERRRPRGQMLGGLLSRLPAATNGGSREAGADASPALPGPARPGPRRSGTSARPGLGAAPERGSDRRPEPPPRDASGDGVTLGQALGAFNASDHRRTVAGLSRTLGSPRATGLAVRSSNGSPGARLTVAWELTWYQWEVSSGERGPEVRERGKGDTIDQLRAADRGWNLMVDTDGTLEQRAVHAGDAEREDE